MIQKTSIFIVIITGLSLSLNAQVFQADVFQNHIMRRDLRIHTDSGVIDMKIIEEDIKINTKPHLTYYWYKNRKIFTNQGGIGGKVLDGKYMCYSDTDLLIEEGKFYRGLKHGLWKKWDEQGNLLYQKNYARGLLQGKSIFYSQGSVIEIVEYKKGKATGKSQFTKNQESAETVKTDSVSLINEQAVEQPIKEIKN